MSKFDIELAKLEEMLDDIDDSSDKKTIWEKIYKSLIVIACGIVIFWGAIKPIFFKSSGSTRDTKPSYSSSDETADTSALSENCEITEESTQSLVNTTEATQESTQNLIDTNDKLSDESYQEMVSDFAVEIKKLGLSAEQILRFCSIENINTIFRENCELGKNLFNGVSNVQYVNDAAAVLAAVEIHNANYWEENKNLDGFVWLSSSVIDEKDREGMQLVEDYVCKIANAAASGDSAMVNDLVSELICELQSGSLSRLSDGCRFAISSYLELLYDCVAKDYLNDINCDNLNELRNLSSALLDNIFAVMNSTLKSKNDTGVRMATPVVGSMLGKGYNSHTAIKDTTNHGYTSPYTRKMMPRR